jgi:putative DNA primase/helicase
LLDRGHRVDDLVNLADAAAGWTPPAAAQPEAAGPDAEDDPWPSPEPIGAALTPVPAFEPEVMLPAPFAAWVRDIALRSQAPADFVGVAVVIALASLIGRAAAIRPKTHDDWTVVPNLWGLVVGRPGVMKSPALGEALRPLQRLVADAHDAFRVKRKAYEAAAVVREAQKTVLKDKLKKAVRDGGDVAAVQGHLEAFDDAPPPTERRYLVNDSTVEKLGELLNENPNGLLLFRDELSGFLSLMDREGHENDRAFFCEAWNGTGAYTYDRIGRGTIRIDAACLSVLGGLQPGPLHAYLREVFAAGATDDGLIQRFQLLVFPDVSPGWRNVDQWPDRDAKTRAFAIFTALATVEARDLGAHREADEAVAFFRFTPEAQARFNTWRARLEQLVRDPGEHPVVAAHLAKYRSLLPSLALVFHLVDCVAQGQGGPVSEAATARALTWCTYLEAHARRVYQSVTDSAQLAAGVLATKLQRGDLPNPFLVRQIRRKGWSGLTTPEEIHAGLDLLEDHGWVRRVEVRPTAKGGRTTMTFHINPLIERAGR